MAIKLRDKMIFNINACKLFIRRQKVAFLSTLIFGLICHMYMFVGNYPAFSGLNLFINKSIVQISEGRWGAALLMSLNSSVTLPWISGLLSLMFYAIASAIVVDAFGIKKKISICLISAILITFPTIASGFCYLYMGEVFAAAFLFAALAFFLADKTRYGWLVGSVAFCLSLSFYQAHIAVFLMMVLIKLIIMIIDKDKWKTIFINLLKYICIAVIGLLLYFMLFKIILLATNITQRPFNRLDFDSNIFYGLKNAYILFYKYFVNVSAISKNPYKLYTIIYGIISVVLLIKIIIKRKPLGVLRCIAIAFIVLAMPIACNAIFVINPHIGFRNRMYVGYALLFVINIIAVDRYLIDKATSTQTISWRTRILVFATVIITFIFAWNGMIISNIAYMNAQLKYEQEYSIMVRLVDRIEASSLYKEGREVLVCQSASSMYSDHYSSPLDPFLSGMPQRKNYIIGNQYGFVTFSNLFIRSNINITSVDGEKAANIMATKEFQSLEPWPSNNCIGLLDNKLIIRLY